MILASQSPRRIELMQEAGYAFDVVPADIDESPLPNETPLELVERLAADKAELVAQTAAQADEIVIAADTIVAIDGEKLGKPANEAEATAMLKRLSGRSHQVATGVCIIKGEEVRSFTTITEVTFYDLTEEEIEAYVTSGEPMDKAGAYGIQGKGGRMLVRSIKGDFYNVVGLPVARLKRAIDAFSPTPSQNSSARTTNL